MNAKFYALDEELRTKSNQLQSALSKISRLEESHQSDIEQLNGEIQHFRSLHEDLNKVLKSKEK